MDLKGEVLARETNPVEPRSRMAGRLALALLALMGVDMSVRGADVTQRPVDAAALARFPAPGTVLPGGMAFSADGKALIFLKSEANDSGRVLWRVDVDPGSMPRVIARPPGQGTTESNVSRAEALRRERMRLRETGITQVVHAARADVSVIPIRGDLYLLRGAGPLERLTETAATEIDPRLSADGSLLAFVRDDELYVLDLASRKETRLTEGATTGLSHGLAEFIAQEEMDRFAGYWWSPDGKLIAYQETDERDVPNFSIVHQGGEDWSVETHRYPFAGKVNARVRLGVISASGGKTTWLDLFDQGEDGYLARVHWTGPATLLVEFLTRDQKTLKLYRFDTVTGARSLLFTETSDHWINLSHHLHTLESSGEIVWSSERTGFRHLELRDREGHLIRALTSGDWPVEAVLAVDEARREVWFSSNRDDARGCQVYRVSLDGSTAERITAEPGTHLAVVAKNGNAFVDIFSDRNKPPMTTLRDRSGQPLLTIDDAGLDPRLAELKIVPPVLTEYRNRDGVKLFGAFYAPRSTPVGEKAPLVVLVYGGPHVQRVTDSWSLTADMTAQFLAARGFAVWKTDNRGSARRGLSFEAAIARNLGRVEVHDQVDGVAFVAASWPDVDTTRVGISGGSYGGYMTLRCLALAPEVFKAGVAIAPVTSWDGYDTCYTERYMGTPANNAAGYNAASVLTHVDTIRGRLLLIHGLLDENVHFRHSARLTNALIEANRPFELLALPESRHSPRRQADRKYVAERTAEFFEKALGMPGR